MGYSPMSPGELPSDTATKRIPTKDDVSLAGGVWAPTSSKRDKLGELKAALLEGQESLDDVATPDQKLDLYLADGLKLITKVADTVGVDDGKDGAASGHATQTIQDFSEWLSQLQENRQEFVNQTELEDRLQVISAKLSKMLEYIPSDRCLMTVRDFLDPDGVNYDDIVELEKAPGLAQAERLLNMDADAFDQATLRYRLLLTQAAVDQVKKSWKTLTTVSDGDIDRAAVQGLAAEPPVTVSFSGVCAVLQSHVLGTCSDRVTALWNLLDRDGDGLLDESEMNQVAFLALGIEQEALQVLFQESLDAFPVRSPLPMLEESAFVDPAPIGWRQRRMERKAKKQLNRMFQRSCKKHFEDEVEINHRLRCIYAWANKQDQENKIESVLVDADGWSGRKRYVELSPKISEEEFREVQSVHFNHLDQIGVEIVKSFREDLWVAQGRGRERSELVQSSLLFLTAVSVVDLAIGIM